MVLIRRGELFKDNRKVRKNKSPVSNWHSPLSNDISISEINHFNKRIIAREKSNALNQKFKARHIVGLLFLT